MGRRNREPKPPSVVDEILSVISLRSSPWVRKRIKHLNLVGRKVQGWTPPTYSDSQFHSTRKPPS
jgi:hypothetical protein